METLYIVRHGIAELVDAQGQGGRDEDRQLTPKGLKRARQVASGLRRLGVAVDQIVTSPLPRARDTAEVFNRVLDPFNSLKVVEDDRLRPESVIERIAELLATLEDPVCMIVGHNPTCSQLITYLVSGGLSDEPLCELKKCGVACLAIHHDAPARLEWLATPKLLRALGED